ncbi:MAG: hypothetical protein O2958_12505 [Gemmatimonadetes bacterium]|nr:hypothetical protein [Gemmatimonadota bacterium]MDA1103613.1 hypothetical protein [Gemmatimonadota bacterium]
MNGYRKLGLIAIALGASTACTTVVVEAPGAAVGAQLSVERFLQAANDHDVIAMGRIFGTPQGAAMDTGGTFGCAFKKIGSWFGGQSCVRKQDVEIRMDAIASILEHEDYQVVREQRVAGRDTPTTRVLVNMTTRDGSVINDVPFVVVQASHGRWLVQEIDLQRVMAAR